MKDLLREEIEKRIEAYEEIEVGGELDEAATNSLTKLMDRYNDMEKAELEKLKLEKELQEKAEKEEAEAKRRKIDMIYDIGKEVVKGVIVFAGMIYFTKWEDENTPTRESQKAFIKSKFFRP